MFQTRPIRVTVLNDKSDLNVRFDLFERLNTGGIQLTNQEIRNCVFRGPYNEQLKKLARTQEFKTAVRLKSTDEHNGTAEEYVLRFFAYLENRANFEHSVKGFFNEYMKDHALRKLTTDQVSVFRKTMSALANAFPDGIKRGQAATTSAVLFEALAVGVADVIRDGQEIDEGILAGLANDPKLKRVSTGATNSRKMLQQKIDYVRRALTL